MEAIKKLHVSLSLEGKQMEVGELVADGRKIYFRYAASFAESQLNISPFKLKLSNEIYEGPARPFEGLHGVFADSVPDGWGRLLLDRTLISRGVLIEDITALQRLAFIGANGMGALQYRPAIEHIDEQYTKLELDAVAREMNNVLEGQSSDVIEELFQLGGSSGGARPKILVGYHPKKDHLIHGSDQLLPGYEHWLIKFPSSIDRKDAANIELAYHYMAVAAGIEMSKCKLFSGKSSRAYFGTKRFDRTTVGKLHMHSVAGLLHDDFRMSSLDYGHMMDCGLKQEGAPALEKIFRLATFNVFAHNRDDHSKNFSFLMNAKGEWTFAPAYDLTFSNSSHGYHSSLVAGESRNPGTANLLELASVFRLKKAKNLIEEVQDSLANWKKHAQKAEVSKSSIQLIGKRIEELITR